MSRSQCLLKLLLQWAVNLTFPPTRFQSKFHLPNCWMSLDFICLIPPRPIPFMLSGNFATTVWVCIDSRHFVQLEQATVFFQNDLNVRGSSSSSHSFMFFYDVFCDIKFLLAFLNIHIRIWFNIIQMIWFWRLV